MDRDVAIVNVRTEMMISNVDVFCARTKFVVCRHVQGPCVVLEDSTMDFGLSARNVETQ